MDCGPATLKCLLEGFGIPASYARLQEACQTDLDGTSINTIEHIAVTLGLDAEQIMLPTDHLLLRSARALPALLVVRRDNMAHFLVVWRRHGRFVQLMDPAKGRRWLRLDALQDELYVHQQRVPVSAWRGWAGSPDFLTPLQERLDAIGIPDEAAAQLLQLATTDPGWQRLALVDAATRLAAELVRGGGLRRGREAGRVLETIVQRTIADSNLYRHVPRHYWSVLPDPTPGGEDRLVLRGAVLLRIRGRREAATGAAAATVAGDQPRPVDATLASAINQPPERPIAAVWRLVRQKGLAAPALLAAASLLVAAGSLAEVMLLRGVVEIGNILDLREHRIITTVFLVGFVAGLVVLELAIADGVLRIGRRIEAQLRAAFSEKLSRLSDRYFQSRLISDMAYRVHCLEELRGLPDLGARLARVAMQLVFTAFALAWLDPPSWWVALLAVTVAIVVPLATERMLAERELRQRNHTAALSRHYLDSLLGLVAGRTHSAERALRSRHESLLVEWGRASLHLLRGGIVVEGIQMLVGSVLAAWLVLAFVGRGSRPGSTLLLVYWTLTLPQLARELAGIIRVFPAYRNILTRLLEPLSAADDAPAPQPISQRSEHAEGVAIAFDSVDVVIRGHQILSDVNVAIPRGQHVAVVGRSGAGKSTLVGLLLGWRTPTAGSIRIDHVPLDEVGVSSLRRSTAWVDPTVHLWNRSLFDNLRYGDQATMISGIGAVIESAELGEILEKLPAGLQQPLGEGGRLTSGGEGQRVRFGRALVRRDVRLAILDEPFRGLDRSRRRELLVRAREIWRNQTMLCVTHDIEETLDFERVLVVENGQLVEDGNPLELSRQETFYASLLAAEREVRTRLWSGARWRRWRMQDGAIVEDNANGDSSWTIDQPASSGQ
jgi:ABC-type bacteriocin/lantibiotic exporter with double-glycine peptidase domain